MAAIAYTLLQNAIVAEHGPHSRLASAVGSDAIRVIADVLRLIWNSAVPAHRICE